MGCLQELVNHPAGNPRAILAAGAPNPFRIVLEHYQAGGLASGGASLGRVIDWVNGIRSPEVREQRLAQLNQMAFAGGSRAAQFSDMTISVPQAVQG